MNKKSALEWVDENIKKYENVGYYSEVAPYKITRKALLHSMEKDKDRLALLLYLCAVIITLYICAYMIVASGCNIPAL